MDSRLLVPATQALLEGWCGPVVWLPAGATTGIPATWDGRVGVISYRHGGVVDAWDWETTTDDALLLDLSRAECRDRVARVLTRTEDHPEGWPARVVWDAGRMCWELIWLAEQLEIRDVISDLGVPWLAMEGIAHEDEHAALAAIARELFHA